MMLQEAATGYYPPDIGDRSDRWKPLVFNVCTPSMPRAWAPCLREKHPNIEMAEEIIYPDFRIRIPNMINEEQRVGSQSSRGWHAAVGASHALDVQAAAHTATAQKVEPQRWP